MTLQIKQHCVKESQDMFKQHLLLFGVNEYKTSHVRSSVSQSVSAFLNPLQLFSPNKDRKQTFFLKAISPECQVLMVIMHFER